MLKGIKQWCNNSNKNLIRNDYTDSKNNDYKNFNMIFKKNVK